MRRLGQCIAVLDWIRLERLGIKSLRGVCKASRNQDPAPLEGKMAGSLLRFQDGGHVAIVMVVT